LSLMWAGRAREASVLRSASWHAACGRGVRLKQGVPTFCKSDARARDAHQGVPLVPLISPRSNPVFSPWADSAVGKGARACTRTDRHSDTHQPVFFLPWHVYRLSLSQRRPCQRHCRDRDRGPDRDRLRTSAHRPRPSSPSASRPRPGVCKFSPVEPPEPASTRPVPHGLTLGGPKRGLAGGSLAQTLPKRHSPRRLSRTRPPRGKRHTQAWQANTQAMPHGCARRRLVEPHVSLPRARHLLHLVAPPTCFPAACPSACLHPNKAGVEYLRSYLPGKHRCGVHGGGTVTCRPVSCRGMGHGEGTRFSSPSVDCCGAPRSFTSSRAAFRTFVYYAMITKCPSYDEEPAGASDHRPCVAFWCPSPMSYD
jgi:hypothetical protein